MLIQTKVLLCIWLMLMTSGPNFRLLISSFFIYILFKESLKLARSLFVSSHCIQWEVQMTAVKLRLFPTSRRRSHGEMQPIERPADGATIWRCQKVEKKWLSTLFPCPARKLIFRRLREYKWFRPHRARVCVNIC